MTTLETVRDTEISRTFWKGLHVLEAWRGSEIDLSGAEIAARTGLNRAIVRRLVRTLEMAGFLEEARGRYRMTVKVLRLTQGFVGGRGVAQVIQPILRLASQEAGESVSFSMPDGDEAVYVAHAFLPTRFTLNMVTVGTRVPMVPTAVGRAILAFLPPSDVADVVAGGRGMSHDTLEGLLARVRRAGYAEASGEYIDGVASIAAPVFASDGPERGPVIGAVSVIFPQDCHAPSSERGALVTRLRQCAAELGATL